ncbi:hypothetical protein B0H17DRAFT_1333323 [Mycena rosella]|uniref:Uncharacterized protein n=1 Tax=Mycena rosella TaxID=1033263 RepID=A0AAD7GAB5_MYCRO|nr:hypothetical protein B0H17DRAFT_1333323 [Mycena rosella]
MNTTRTNIVVPLPLCGCTTGLPHPGYLTTDPKLGYTTEPTKYDAAPVSIIELYHGDAHTPSEQPLWGSFSALTGEDATTHVAIIDQEYKFDCACRRNLEASPAFHFQTVKASTATDPGPLQLRASDDGNEGDVINLERTTGRAELTGAATQNSHTIPPPLGEVSMRSLLDVASQPFEPETHQGETMNIEKPDEKPDSEYDDDHPPPLVDAAGNEYFEPSSGGTLASVANVSIDKTSTFMDESPDAPAVTENIWARVAEAKAVNSTDSGNETDSDSMPPLESVTNSSVAETEWGSDSTDPEQDAVPAEVKEEHTRLKNATESWRRLTDTPTRRVKEFRHSHPELFPGQFPNGILSARAADDDRASRTQPARSIPRPVRPLNPSPITPDTSTAVDGLGASDRYNRGEVADAPDTGTTLSPSRSPTASSTYCDASCALCALQIDIDSESDGAEEGQGGGEVERECGSQYQGEGEEVD